MSEATPAFRHYQASERRRIAFILAATDSGPMIVNRLDFDPKLMGGVGLQILEFGNYELGEINIGGGLLTALRKTRGDGVVVIDGGANIGTHTMEWAAGMRWWGSVIAIEAQERVFYALCGNIALNNLSNAQAIKAVISDTPGQMIIPELRPEIEANFGGLHMDGDCDVGQEPTRNVMVKTLMIDALGLTRLDLLKLDIEGMEPRALDGAKRTIEQFRPVVIAEHIVCGKDAIIDRLPGYDITEAGMNLICIAFADPVRKIVSFKGARDAKARILLPSD